MTRTLKVLKKRWKSKTPRFFKKLQRIFIGIGVFSGAVLTSASQITEFELHPVLFNVFAYISVFATAVTLAFGFTSENGQQIDAEAASHAPDNNPE